MAARMKLVNRTAVVTGAAAGIGRAISLSLARRGCHLALADVNETGLAETAQLAAATGGGGRTGRGSRSPWGHADGPGRMAPHQGPRRARQPHAGAAAGPSAFWVPRCCPDLEIMIEQLPHDPAVEETSSAEERDQPSPRVA